MILGRAACVVAGVAVAAAARRWHTGWGATGAEKGERLPGDEYPVSRFGMRATRAMTIHASPALVWPWIVQLGFGKAGWYSYDLLDNLGRPSARSVLPQWQQVAVGDPAAPMNPLQGVDDSPWRVAQVAVPHVLVWRHVNAGTWAWILRPLPSGGTRLVTRLRISYANPGGLAFAPILELADFPMYRKMLLGIRERAENRR
ncbi:hypothetical protein AU192_04365 [Mycobacterium lehmannii]|uniref:Polyketide cyclase n=1 Tax=Mycobacterium lehmannii TaxID=2048550 RepID=A0A101AAJ5_9MYCO|nr:hypothetical protein [Mycobacterium lehmannii]KUI19132.1 hypothetical protein AU192_04365 [Mycobacterium lehmannii]